MADDKEPTPAELAQRALDTIFTPTGQRSGTIDPTAYRLAGGAEGVARLQRQAATAPPEAADPTPPPTAEDAIGFGSEGWAARYLAVRSQLFDDAERRRTRKK